MSPNLLARLLPHNRKHSTNNVPAAAKLEDGPTTSSLATEPTFESTDDSSGSGTNSPTKMQSPESPDVSSSSFIGEYDPSRSLRITKRPVTVSSSAGPAKNKWIDDGDDDGDGGSAGGGGPPGLFRTDHTSPPPRWARRRGARLGRQEEGGTTTCQRCHPAATIRTTMAPRRARPPMATATPTPF